MSEAEGKRGKLVFSASDGRGGSFKSFFITLFILFVVFMVFVAVAVRLETGRVTIQDYLKNRIGVPVKVESSRIGLPYVLVLEGVETEGFGSPDVPGLSIREIRVGVGLKSLFKVSVYGGTLNLVKDSDGRWRPELFARLGDLPSGNISDISRVTEGFRGRVGISLRECTVMWRGEKSSSALASKINFDVVRVRLPKQEMFFHWLAVYNAVWFDGQSIRDVEFSWLASKENSYVELSRSADGISGSAAGFWECVKGEAGSEPMNQSPAGTVQGRQ